MKKLLMTILLLLCIRANSQSVQKLNEYCDLVCEEGFSYEKERYEGLRALPKEFVNLKDELSEEKFTKLLKHFPAMSIPAKEVTILLLLAYPERQKIVNFFRKIAGSFLKGKLEFSKENKKYYGINITKIFPLIPNIQIDDKTFRELEKLVFEEPGEKKRGLSRHQKYQDKLNTLSVLLKSSPNLPKFIDRVIEKEDFFKNEEPFNNYLKLLKYISWNTKLGTEPTEELIKKYTQMKLSKIPEHHLSRSRQIDLFTKLYRQDFIYMYPESKFAQNELRKIDPTVEVEQAQFLESLFNNGIRTGALTKTKLFENAISNINTGKGIFYQLYFKGMTKKAEELFKNITLKRMASSDPEGGRPFNPGLPTFSLLCLNKDQDIIKKIKGSLQKNEFRDFELWLIDVFSNSKSPKFPVASYIDSMKRPAKSLRQLIESTPVLIPLMNEGQKNELIKSLYSLDAQASFPFYPLQKEFALNWLSLNDTIYWRKYFSKK